MKPEQLKHMTRGDIIGRYAPRDDRGAIIEEHPDAQYTIDGKPTTADRYYEELGREIEQHPIFNPARRSQ